MREETPTLAVIRGLSEDQLNDEIKWLEGLPQAKRGDTHKLRLGLCHLVFLERHRQEQLQDRFPRFKKAVVVFQLSGLFKPEEQLALADCIDWLNDGDNETKMTCARFIEINLSRASAIQKIALARYYLSTSQSSLDCDKALKVLEEVKEGSKIEEEVRNKKDSFIRKDPSQKNYEGFKALSYPTDEDRRQFAPKCAEIRQALELGEAIEQKNDSDNVYLGNLYCESGDYVSAEVAFTRVTPTREVLYKLGIAQDQQKKYNEAMQTFRQSARLLSKSITADIVILQDHYGHRKELSERRLASVEKTLKENIKNFSESYAQALVSCWFFYEKDLSKANLHLQRFFKEAKEILSTESSGGESHASWRALCAQYYFMMGDRKSLWTWLRDILRLELVFESFALKDFVFERLKEIPVSVDRVGRSDWELGLDYYVKVSGKIGNEEKLQQIVDYLIQKFYVSSESDQNIILTLLNKFNFTHLIRSDEESKPARIADKSDKNKDHNLYAAIRVLKEKKLTEDQRKTHLTKIIELASNEKFACHYFWRLLNPNGDKIGQEVFAGLAGLVKVERANGKTELVSQGSDDKALVILGICKAIYSFVVEKNEGALGECVLGVTNTESRTSEAFSFFLRIALHEKCPEEFRNKMLQLFFGKYDATTHICLNLLSEYYRQNPNSPTVKNACEYVLKIVDVQLLKDRSAYDVLNNASSQAAYAASPLAAAVEEEPSVAVEPSAPPLSADKPSSSREEELQRQLEALQQKNARLMAQVAKNEKEHPVHVLPQRSDANVKLFNRAYPECTPQENRERVARHDKEAFRAEEDKKSGHRRVPSSPGVLNF